MSEDYFGLLDESKPIYKAPDVILMAWERYDEAATTLHRQNLVKLEAGEAVKKAAAAEQAAHEDKECLMGECECPDDGTAKCQKCRAYTRVIEWSNHR